MDVFRWDHEFVTGLEAVDTQHHGLLDLFNTLHDRLFRGHEATAGELDVIFGQLLDYAGVHFADEEAFMDAAGLDERHVDGHRTAHRQFVENVQLLWQQRDTMHDAPETIMQFLTSWLGLHILGVDKSMARQFNSIRAGATAIQAFEHESREAERGTMLLLRMVNNLYHVLAQQNAGLVDANRRLEQRVQARTRELELANAQLEKLARVDGLLGIQNRGSFDLRLVQEVARARRDKKPLAVVMMDVDFFKRYNDLYGHQAGDVCLQAVARAAGAQLRRPGDFLARYGGEELVAVLPTTDLDGALLVANAIVAAVRNCGIPHAASDAAPVVTISAGVAAMIPDSGEVAATARGLVSNADAALYAAKQRGRDRVVGDSSEPSQPHLADFDSGAMLVNVAAEESH